jgi:hypothetical protein
MWTRSLLGRRAVWALSLMLVLALVPGCNRNPHNLAEVEGTVLIEGKPVPGLTLTFQPDSDVATTSVAYTDERGDYYCQYTRDLRGAYIGKHTVSINHWPPDDYPRDAIRYRIPARYNTNSELQIEVKPGHNTFDWDVKLDTQARP